MKFRKNKYKQKNIVSIVSIVFKITLTDCLEKKRKQEKKEIVLKKQKQKQEEKEIVLKKQKATAAMEIVHRLLWLLI